MWELRTNNDDFKGFDSLPHVTSSVVCTEANRPCIGICQGFVGDTAKRNEIEKDGFVGGSRENGCIAVSHIATLHCCNTMTSCYLKRQVIGD